MDGTTAAERICPWRRSSIPDEARSRSSSLTNDPLSGSPTSSNTNDPHLHPTPLTSANFSGTYHKSPEYMDEYATTTKPEEHSSRPHVRDLFNTQSRAPDEKQENDTEADSDDHMTRL
jgi:hypothetical protein